MPFHYKEHTGEIWLVATGQTLEEAFAEGALALFNVMVPVSQIEPKMASKIGCNAAALDLLFFEWLNALVVRKDAQNLLFSKCEIEPIKKTDLLYELHAVVWGESFDAAKHGGQVDVKAATFSELKCVKTEDGWCVECVLDI